jgi:hypothetical protein
MLIVLLCIMTYWVLMATFQMKQLRMLGDYYTVGTEPSEQRRSRDGTTYRNPDLSWIINNRTNAHWYYNNGFTFCKTIFRSGSVWNVTLIHYTITPVSRFKINSVTKLPDSSKTMLLVWQFQSDFSQFWNWKDNSVIESKAIPNITII